MKMPLKLPSSSSSPPARQIRPTTSTFMSRGGGDPWRRSPHRHDGQSGSHFLIQHHYGRGGFRPLPCPTPQLRGYGTLYDNHHHHQHHHQQQHGYRIPQAPPPRGVSHPIHGYSRPRPADYRNWVPSKSHPPPHCERFRLLSYNILADYLAWEHRSKLYFHIPPNILNWEWRKRKILIEIGLWSPDIMCLQEVDRFQDLEKEMVVRGYAGIWKMRTGLAKDGCATFWRTNRFQLRHEEFIEFNRLGLRDNIAQICVLESRAREHAEPGSASLRSPSQTQECNRIIVCNIHVLYNPKRGEIKLGQVRILLDRAHSISRLWNNAHVVLCGDFNSVPKSPLYNFLSEQKLNLSGLARDQISGQHSASIRAPRTYSGYGQHGTGSPPNSFDYKCGFAPAVQNNCYSEMPPSQGSVADLNFVEKPASFHQHEKESSELSDALSRELHEKLKMNAHGCFKLWSALEEGNTNSCDFMSSNQINEQKVSSFKEIHVDSEFDNNLEVDVVPQDSSMETCPTENKILTPECSDKQPKIPEDDLQSNIDSHNSLSRFHSEIKRSEAEHNYVKLKADRSTGDYSKVNFDQSVQFNSVDHRRDNINDPLHYDPDPKSPAEQHGLDDMNASTEGNKNACSTVCHQASDLSTQFQNKDIYNPSIWTPADIETASGNPDCDILQHELKLKSVYTEVEDCAGTRGSSGEPEVTSYNRQFMGTVDYIWRTEGLHTIKVLDTIRKDVLQRTPGFPTPKWGSDHLAIGCELAFLKE